MIDQRVNYICDLGCDIIDEVLDALGVDYLKNSKRITGPCPIHQGDNTGAFNIYPDNQRGFRGYWICYTQHCEKKYGNGLVGFIRGILSAQQNKQINYNEAIKWLCNFLGFKSLNEVKIDKAEEERGRYVSVYGQLNSSLNSKNKKKGWRRQHVVSKLEIPARYYLDRGYSESILYRYDVGFYSPQGRVVVPIYDDNYKLAVGFTKRATKPSQAPKWLHSDGFVASESLYNLWFAGEEIKRTKTVVLVEGPGDVWRLEECGIHNSVALYKNSISNSQILKLLNCGVMSAVVLLDNDEAGREGAKQIHQELSPFVRLFYPTIKGGDVGELGRDRISVDVLPLIRKVEEIYNVK